MKTLNLFIFLIIFFGIINNVNAQNSCTYHDNLDIHLSSYLTQNYNISFGAGSAGINTYTHDFQLSGTNYFPTYFIIQCNYTPSASNTLYVAFKRLDRYGNCTVSDSSTMNLGFSGIIQDLNNSNKQIGGWVYYKYINRAEFYATYNEYPVGHTLYYKNTFAWPLDKDYCEITNFWVKYGTTSGSFTVNPVNPLLTNFVFAYGTGAFNLPVWQYVQGTYGHVKDNSVLGCTINMRYTVYNTVKNLNITYYLNSKVLNVSFIANFPGYINIKNANANYTYAFGKNTLFTAYIPYINYTLNIYDNNSNLLYSIYLPKASGLTCLDQPDTGLYSVRLKDAADNLIVNFKIIYANQTYTSDSNGVVNMPKLTNAPITVIPLFRQDLAFNTTLTTQPGITYITVPIYTYTVKINVRYVYITGEQIPIGFSYTFNGQEYADKVNLTAENIAVGGNAYDNTTVQLLAGNYQLTLKTSLNYLGADLITKQINYNLSLFDDNYYRELTWYTGLFGDSINQTGANMPILSITVVDQNSKPVENAYIYLNDSNNTNLAIKPTDKNGNAVFYVQSGKEYIINVYYNGIFKATKTVNYPADELSVQITFQIYISPGEIQQTIGQNLTQEQVQNQIAAILILILTNYAIWAFIFIIIFAAYAARISGSPEIGILTAIICIGVFTFIVPWLPVQLLALLGVIAGIMLGLKVVRERG